MPDLKCQYCGSEQQTTIMLEDHEAVHNLLSEMGDFLEYKCTLCPASFINQQLLDTHHNDKHPSSCFWCLEDFSGIDALLQHEKIHDFDNQPSPTKRICLDISSSFDDTNQSAAESHQPKQFSFSSPLIVYHRSPTGSLILPSSQHSSHLDQPESSAQHLSQIESPIQSPIAVRQSPIPGSSHVNQRGAGNDKLSYTIRKINEKTFKNAVIDRHYKVQFHPDQVLENQKLSNLHVELGDMFDKVLDEAKTGLQGSDLIRVIVHHPDLINAIHVPLQKIDNLTPDTIMEYVENVLTSHENLTMGDEFSLDVGTMELPKGGARKQINCLTGGNNSVIQKRSIIEIANDDYTCLARAILMGFLKTKTMTTKEWKELTTPDFSLSIEELVLKYRACPLWYYNILTDKAKAHRQTDLTMGFCRQAHVSTFKYLNINDIAHFEQFLDVDVLVVCAKLGNKFIRVPKPESNKPRLYVYLVENDGIPHFHAIVNICGFFGASQFCSNCLKPYQKKHSCEISCYICDSKGCNLQNDQVSCRQCHMTCRSLECFSRHLEKKPRHNNQLASQCDLYWKCTRCKKVINTSKRDQQDHQCGEWQCKCCSQYVDEDHLCYVRALDPQESSGKFIFFDIETTQDEKWTCNDGYEPAKTPGCMQCKSDILCKPCSRCKNCLQSLCGKYQHKANLIIAQKVCPTCIEQPLLPNSKCEMCGMRCKTCKKFNKVDNVYEMPPCKNTCGYREVIFKGDKCVNNFGKWLFSETHKNFSVLAHNMRAYDGYFLMEYLIDQSIYPDSIIYAGSKIMYMHISRGLNIRVIDSLNFLPMPLAQLPGAFDLKELQKGYFPHFWNTTAHIGYRGPYPEPRYYGCDTMSSENREKFMKWYQNKITEGAIFDFDEEIIQYCRSDVDILRRACLTFRNILLNITGKEEEILDDSSEPNVTMKNAVDPFNDITIASVCSKVYRTKFLEETWKVKVRKDGVLSDWLPAKKLDGAFSIMINNEWLNDVKLQDHDYVIEEKVFVKSPIAQIPSTGYNRDQFSKVSIKWLEWVVEKSQREGRPIFIQHALNKGEYRIPKSKYRLDGYCEATNTAYEFNGCLYHGCPTCFPKNRQTTKLPRTKQSLDELYALTIKKKEYIKSLGMKYVSMWEHDFTKLLKSDSEAKRFTEQLDIQERLNPRDSFFGGRTNALRLQKKLNHGEKIHYVDYTSLYPFVNKYANYPVGHPQIITSELEKVNLNNIFGIVKCKILPPRKLYLPILSMKCNGKLTFPLCRTCAEEQNQETCNHNNRERCIIGTWCTPELNKALELGYELIKVYEIYHWPETTQFDSSNGTGGLFASYINLFLKIKQESSNWPIWVKTEDDMVEYLRLYFEKEGIQLDRNNIRQNKALRSLAKLMLNSFWGKFGQRLNMPQTSFFHESEADKFFRCLSDPKKSVKDFHIVTDDIIQVSFENHDEFVEENHQTNVFIATFTTCWARLKLYEVLEMLQERVLYHDTDSVIYVSSPGDPEPKLGDFLGELTSELEDGDHIVHFVAGGPKQYAYKTLKGQQVCKIRGFSLNYTNQKLLNFDSMLELIDRSDDSFVTVTNPSKICRDKRKRKLFNRAEEKNYKIVYSKRVIQKDSFDTLPYGY